MTGAATGSITADSSGQFTLNNLPAGNYTVTATRSGYAMTPPSQSVTLTTGGATGVNFTAQPVVIERHHTAVCRRRHHRCAERRRLRLGQRG